MNGSQCVSVCVLLLWVCEVVHQRHFLHQVSPDGAHQLVEVVLCEAVLLPCLALALALALWQPEGDVVVEGGVLAEGLKHTQDNDQSLICYKSLHRFAANKHKIHGNWASVFSGCQTGHLFPVINMPLVIIRT